MLLTNSEKGLEYKILDGMNIDSDNILTGLKPSMIVLYLNSKKSESPFKVEKYDYKLFHNGDGLDYQAIKTEEEPILDIFKNSNSIFSQIKTLIEYNPSQNSFILVNDSLNLSSVYDDFIPRLYGEILLNKEKLLNYLVNKSSPNSRKELMSYLTTKEEVEIPIDVLNN